MASSALGSEGFVDELAYVLPNFFTRELTFFRYNWQQVEVTIRILLIPLLLYPRASGRAPGKEVGFSLHLL
jgi:hypothetical protein